MPNGWDSTVCIPRFWFCYVSVFLLKRLSAFSINIYNIDINICFLFGKDTRKPIKEFQIMVFWILLNLKISQNSLSIFSALRTFAMALPTDLKYNTNPCPIFPVGSTMLYKAFQHATNVSFHWFLYCHLAQISNAW